MRRRSATLAETSALLEFHLAAPPLLSNRRSSWSSEPQKTGSDGSGKHGATSEWTVFERPMPLWTPSESPPPAGFDIEETNWANKLVNCYPIRVPKFRGDEISPRERKGKEEKEWQMAGKVNRKNWEFLACEGADSDCVRWQFICRGKNGVQFLLWRYDVCL